MTFRTDDFEDRLPARPARIERETTRQIEGQPRRFDEERLDLRGLVRVLKRRYLTILGTLAAVMALVFLFFAVTTPLYTASVQVLIDPRDRRILQTEVTPTTLGGDANLVESQVRIMVSDAVLARVVRKLNLAQSTEFGRVDPTTLGARVRGLLGMTPTETDDPETRALRVLQRRVSVRRAERTYIIEVRATSRDPAMAARLADAIGDSYIADQAEAVQSTTRRASNALGGRLDELRDAVRLAEGRVQEFRQRNNLVGTPGNVLVTEQQLSEVNQRLVLARARAAEAQARFDQLDRALRNGSDQGAISDALNSPVIGALRAQFSEISRREVELLNNLGPRHPQVVDIRGQLQNVRRLIAEELRRIADASRNELAVARSAEAAIQAEVDRLSRRTQDTDGNRIRLRELEREVDAARQIFEAFLNRSRQTSEQEFLETVGARVIAPAIQPLEPSFPPRMLTMVLGFLGGLGLGITIALLREHMDDTYRAAAQLRRVASLDLLAAVPLVGGAKRLKLGGPGGLSFDVIDRPSGPFAAAIRTLRNELRDGPGRASERSLLVVSAEEGEGKTEIALNLALAAAASGERVLIIDADLGGRALSRRIAPDASVGLLEVLDGDVRLQDALVRDPRSGLAALPLVVPRGGIAERPSRAQYALLLDAAKPHFDYVVFDGGALLEDFGARTVGEAVDQIVTVVRAGRTRRAAVVEALELLRAPKSKLTGAVLNMADRKASTQYDLG